LDMLLADRLKDQEKIVSLTKDMEEAKKLLADRKTMLDEQDKKITDLDKKAKDTDTKLTLANEAIKDRDTTLKVLAGELKDNNFPDPKDDPKLILISLKEAIELARMKDPAGMLREARAKNVLLEERRKKEVAALEDQRKKEVSQIQEKM